MSDRIAVFHQGVCVQCDAPEVLFRRPRTRFVAGFFRGSNLVEGDVLDHTDTQLRVRIGERSLVVGRPPGLVPRGSRVAVAIRAENVRIGSAARRCSVQLDAVVSAIVYRGTTVDHIVELRDGQRLAATSTRREIDAPGARTPCGFDPEDVVVLED